MSEPFLAEVRMVGFNFAPRGYAQCDGQLLPISQNQSLFSLLGTIYGGDGRTTFALPDLRGRSPVHEGTRPPDGHSVSLGQRAGAETHTLQPNELATHGHALQAASATGNTPLPIGTALAGYTGGYAPTGSATVDIRSGTVLPSGGGQAHNNMQPYLAINFLIALQGLFPSRN